MPEIGEISKDEKTRKSAWTACQDCGKERWVQLVKGKPISKLCGKCARKGKHPPPEFWFKKGKEHPFWRGGKFENQGYIYILQPSHLKADCRGYVGEHILNWEQTNNMPLPNGYVVHHINAIRNDNRPKNLLALPKQGHSPSLTVKEVQKRLREIEAELAQMNMFQS